jgi:hypothetical protein
MTADTDARDAGSPALDALFLAVSAERDVPSLCEYPAATVAAAKAAIATLTAEVRATRDPAARDTIDAITEHLADLARFREEKILHLRDAPAPLTASPAERIAHAEIAATIARLRGTA